MKERTRQKVYCPDCEEYHEVYRISLTPKIKLCPDCIRKRENAGNRRAYRKRVIVTCLS